MATIVLANNKGGVAKTDTTRYLGLNLWGLGRKVLLVDLDPQASLTRRLLGKDTPIHFDIADVLNRKAGWRDALLRLDGGKPNEPIGLALLPATSRLENAKVAMTQNAVGVMNLKAALANVTSFDVILIDTAPDMGALTMAAMVAADYLIIPLQAETDAIAGIDRVKETLAKLEDSLTPAIGWLPPRILGTIAVMVENNLQHQQNIERIRAFDRLPLLGIIPARRGSSRGRNRENALRAAYLPIAEDLNDEVFASGTP